jgi:hypothetical protein
VGRSLLTSAPAHLAKAILGDRSPPLPGAAVTGRGGRWIATPISSRKTRWTCNATAPQGARNAIPKQTLDDQGKLVLEDKGTVENDQGTVQYDRVQLNYCHIVAPICRPDDPLVARVIAAAAAGTE